VTLPRFPVYVISKGRADCCLTARALIADGVPFRLVVEPQERELYEAAFGTSPLCRITVTPFANLGKGGIPARNFCWEHSRAAGAERHWILDDNIRKAFRLYRGKRLPCAFGPALEAAEHFVERYANVAIAGLNYDTFAMRTDLPPFYLNVHVYSCLLIRNDLGFRWRGRYNEDTDLCLQALAREECTVLFNAFLIGKVATMTMKGGNSDVLYQGDGRLRMARSLEKAWPGVVETVRKFKRPQHHVKGNWKWFDTPLKLKPGVEVPEAPNERGMKLRAVGDVASPRIRAMLEEQDK